MFLRTSSRNSFAAVVLAFTLTGLLGTIVSHDTFLMASGSQVSAPSQGSSDDRSPGCLDDILDCPPSGGNASYVAGIARTVRMEKNACLPPFRSAVVPAKPGLGDTPAVPATFMCVLDADATMIDTIEIDSFTTVDCQGHKLTPRELGTPGDLSRRSDPEVAFFLNEVYGTRISNCVIEGFDYGIFGIRSKVPAHYKSHPVALATLRNSIVFNRINVRFSPISLYLMDNTVVESNTVSFTSAGGLGISVSLDSDLNAIRHNSVTGNIGSSPLDSAPAVPGPVIPVNDSSNPEFSSRAVAIFVGHFGGNPSLLSAVIAGTLYQFTAPNSSVEQDRSEDNLIEGNTVTLNNTGTAPLPNGIASSQAVRSVIRGNVITRGNTGILTPGNVGMTRAFPGTCSLNSTRLCLIDNDCNIPVFDIESKGMCIGATGQKINLPSKDLVLEQNVLHGPFTNFGINTGNAANQLLIRNNRIVGPASGAGLRVGGLSLQDGTNSITRNIVADVDNAILLDKMDAAFFSAKFSLNDFFGYVTAVRTSNGYNIPSELSVNDQGNYWGRPCPGFNRDLVRALNGAVIFAVVDSHPYGVPVAGLEVSPDPCQ